MQEEVISSVAARPVLDESTFTRLTWLMNLIVGNSTNLMSRVWNQETLDRIEEKDYKGKGKVAAQSLGWAVEGDDYMTSRWEWVCKAQVFALVTPHVQKQAVFELLLADPSLTNAEVSSLSGGYLSHSIISQMRRRVLKGKPDADTDYTTFSATPRIGNVIRLSVVDDQVIKMDRETGSLEIKLPLCAHPQSMKDWGWTSIDVTIPDYARIMHEGPLTLPTIRIKNDSFSFIYSFKEMIEQNINPHTALGIDWSPSKGAVGAKVREHEGVLTSDYVAHDPSVKVRAMQTKAGRLLTQERELGRKIFRIQKMAVDSEDVAKKVCSLATERRLVGAKRERLNSQIGWKIAGEFVGHALDNGVEMIAIENLSTLQAGGLGKTVNSLVSQSPRAKIASSLSHTSAKVGIRTVMVPARGTSANCTVCDAALSRPSGHYSARCKNGCVNHGDRDVVGAVNIGKRGLLGKASVNRKKKISKATHSPVQKVSRDKSTSTPSQQKRKKIDHAALRRVLRAVHKPNKYYPRYAVALDTCVADVAQVTSVSAACEITHNNNYDGRLSHHGLCE